MHTSGPTTLPERGHIHFIGISGRATAGLAVALHRQGWRVTGSDRRAYGVAKALLDEAAIPLNDDYSADHLPRQADMVLLGGSIGLDNPELLAARESGLPCLTFPEFLAAWTPAQVFNLQVLGTNGKTTTTALILQLLHAAGRKPGFLIGGLHPPLGDTLRLPDIDGREPLMIWEADESRCARWLVRPKFSVLPADAVVLTSLAPDHPESFDSDEDYFEAFRNRLQNLPAEGFIVAHQSDLDRLDPGPLKARIISIGDRHRLDTADGGGGFQLDSKRWTLGIPGVHQSANAALALLAVEALGVTLDGPQLESALAGFQGVKGRSEILIESPIPLIVDEAYHPDAIAATLAAARLRFPGRRWHLLFRPRYLWKPNSYIEKALPAVLAKADMVHLFPEEVPIDQPFPEPGKWRACLLRDKVSQTSTPCQFYQSLDEMRNGLKALLQEGDAILYCASASNYPLRARLVQEVEEIAGGASISTGHPSRPPEG